MVTTTGMVSLEELKERRKGERERESKRGRDGDFLKGKTFKTYVDNNFSSIARTAK